MGAGLTRRSAPAATLPVPAKKGTGRDICGTSGVTLCHLGDSGCSGAPNGARTAGAWVLLPWQVPWVLRSAPCAETRGERSCSCCQNTMKDLGVCSPLGVHSPLRDPCRGRMWLLVSRQQRPQRHRVFGRVRRRPTWDRQQLISPICAMISF